MADCKASPDTAMTPGASLDIVALEAVLSDIALHGVTSLLIQYHKREDCMGAEQMQHPPLLFLSYPANTMDKLHWFNKNCRRI